MTDEFGRLLKARRMAAGLTQHRLAQLSGVQQSTIAAIERGRRTASDDARRRLVAALRVRPRTLLLNRRAEVVAKAAARGVTGVKVFGSVARGDDSPFSDVDLIATYPEGFDLADKAQLVEELEDILTVRVDLVSESSDGAAAAEARGEAVAL